ncbi:MAG: substrate-binding periplasmic protein [Spirochaetia bacterium]
MRNRFHVLCVLFLAVVAMTAGAQTELKAAVGLSLPPYIIQGPDNGVDADIVRQALLASNYTLKLQYVPFARVAVSMANKSADCAFPINEASGVTGVFYSDSHINYQNVVVALKSRALKISSPADLKSLRVVAFGDAPNYLGLEFAAMAKANKSYSELADQQSQVKMLFKDRADALVMDINIFKYFRQNIKDMDVSQDVVFYQIFPPTAYKVAFTSKDVCEKFNAGLKAIKASGKYAEIFKTYIKE